MLKELSMNILHLEALEQIPRYAKFIKDLVSKKRNASHEDVGCFHHCSAITS